jgi:hypothetical protein
MNVIYLEKQIILDHVQSFENKEKAIIKVHRNKWTHKQKICESQTISLEFNRGPYPYPYILLPLSVFFMKFKKKNFVLLFNG